MERRRKMLVITEGEIDALSVSQAQGNKYPVVSIPNGAQGAKKAILNNLAWVESYERVILAFDMDEAGRAVARMRPPPHTRKSKNSQSPTQRRLRNAPSRKSKRNHQLHMGRKSVPAPSRQTRPAGLPYRRRSE